MSTETTTNISAAQVKELRERSGAPMMDCKNALSEAKGDIEGALVWLRKKGIATAAKKAARMTSEGSVASYIHAGGRSACWWRSIARAILWRAQTISKT